MKLIYKGPSDVYRAGGKVLYRDGEPVELDQKAKKQGEDNGHRFEVTQEPKPEPKLSAKEASNNDY